MLNKKTAANAIPPETQDRIFEAVKKFNYHPNYFARSLRAQRSFTLGVMVPELSDGYSATVLSGIEAALANEGYFYLTISHFHRDDLLKHGPQMLVERHVEGIIAVDTPIEFKTTLPVVTIAGHQKISGVTNIVLNHRRAAQLAIEHLIKLGHRRIAVIKGQNFSSDTGIRWDTISEAARKRGIEIDPNLVSQLVGDLPSPEIGYIATKKILENNAPFTALFAFNDISAIGAIRALQESGLRVPEDVSVMGFDDIPYATFHTPTLTTIRQPLFEMGKIASETMLKYLSKDGADTVGIPDTLTVEPVLIVRNSTAPAKHD